MYRYICVEKVLAVSTIAHFTSSHTTLLHYPKSQYTFTVLTIMHTMAFINAQYTRLNSTRVVMMVGTS